MVKKKKLIFVSLILSLLCLSTLIPVLSKSMHHTGKIESSRRDYQNAALSSSASLEGAENINVIKINRTMTIRGTGLLLINDTISIKNQNSFSISSVLIGVPSTISDDLVYLKAINAEGSTLNTHLTDLIMKETYKMIEIQLLSPLQEQENRTISVLQSYKDLITYEAQGSQNQIMGYKGYVLPLLPYQAQGPIETWIDFRPSTITLNDESYWKDLPNAEVFSPTLRKYDLKIESPKSHLDPFLQNLGANKTISPSVQYSGSTKLEVSKLDRTITISPWGIVTVRENYHLTNLGPIPTSSFKLSIPMVAVNAKVSDFFGELKDIQFAQDQDNPSLKEGEIVLINTRTGRGPRSVIEPNSTYKFSLKYQMSLHNYLLKNFIQQTVRMGLSTTYFDFLGRNQNTEVILEGCFSLDYSSIQPDGLSSSTGKTSLTYHNDFVTPFHFEDRHVTLTYTVDSFGLLFWPILYMIVIASLCVAYISLIYRRKKRGITPAAEEKDIPVNEIREFCSLYGEKTALLLEIREAEADLKSKKIPKKKYRMLVKKNENKIDAIEEELKPFRETLVETNETFESLVERLEVLETERQTVRDGMNLLDLRYRKGKLPSRSAYMSLKEDFEKRLKKIDRSIDKTLQQLRGYLI